MEWMNWLDVVLALLIVFAAAKGFFKGFIIEVASLIALVGGIWAGIHLSDRMEDALGLEMDNAALAFLVTFVIVLVGVHLLARFLTTVLDVAQLGLPNKIAGVLFGALRQVFVLSALLNVLWVYSDGQWPSPRSCDRSTLHDPIKSVAPAIFPDLGSAKWVDNALEKVKNVKDELME